VGARIPERDAQFGTMAAGTGGKLLSIDQIEQLKAEIERLLAAQADDIDTISQVYSALRQRGATDTKRIAAEVGRSPFFEEGYDQRHCRR
jgi:uncharacterized membrane-anchored protein YhcB (DUF1043 family)